MAMLYNPPAPGANKYKYAQRIQTEDVSTFMEVSDVEKIDMILESPTGAFKGNFDNNIIRPVNYRVLGTLGMVTITYLYSCGGLNGTETIVTAGGPSIALICLVVFPIIAAIPYAYIVAELCSAFPEDGGFTIWVLNAFGPFWAFQVGWWSWLCGLFRSALVPTFILDTILRYFDKSALDNEGVEWVIKACIGLLLALPTIFGTIPVSRLTTVLVGIMTIVYLIYTIWALTSPGHYDDIVEVRHTNDTYDATIVDVIQDGEVYIDWDTLINVMFYKFDGVYMASVFGGEVMNPARTYPRAILFTMLLTIGTYFLPLPATMMSDKLTWLQFNDSSFYVLGDIIGGKPLKVMMFIATIAASIGTFTSGLYIKGFMISGMANNRLLHASLARRSERFEAPTNAILLTTVCTLALCAVELEDLLILSNAFASVVQFMIIIAAMRLRMTLPYIPRPTKVPGGIPGLMAFALVPAAVLVYVVFDLFNDSIVRGVLLIGLAVVGIAYGFWAVRWK